MRMRYTLQSVLYQVGLILTLPLYRYEIKSTRSNVMYFSINTFRSRAQNRVFFTERTENRRLKLNVGVIFGWSRFVSLIMKNILVRTLKAKRNTKPTCIFNNYYYSKYRNRQIS